jgi:ribosomal protein L7/L12
MKIEINLTTAELKNIVARHLNLPNGLNVDDLTVTISTEVDTRWNKLLFWNDLASLYPHRKIEAIKAVRKEYPGTGLAEAKYAVEASPAIVKEYVMNRGSLSGFRTW